MCRQGRIHAHLHAVPARDDGVHLVNYRRLFLHRQQPIQLVEEIEEEHDFVVHDVGLHLFGDQRQPLAVGRRS